MNGRDERMRHVEQSNLCMVKELPTLLQGFYNSLANLSPNSKKQYLTQITLFLKYTYGDHYTNEDILKTTSGLIDAYLTERNSQNVSKSIIAMQVSAITKLFKYLVDRDLLVRNPVDHSAGRPRIPQKKDIVYLEIDEIQQMFQNIKHGVGVNHRSDQIRSFWATRDLAIAHLFIVTGIREAALADLNMDDLDLENGILRVIDKGNKSDNKILDPDTINILKDWLEDRSDFIKKYDLHGEQAIFISNRGRISVTALQRMIINYTKTLGKHISPHKLRATFGTMYYRASGDDLLMTQEAMGHADVKTTQRYAVPDRSKHQSVINSIAKHIKS